MILTETPRRILVTKLVTWGHWFALINIAIAIIIASVYVFTSSFPGSLIGNVYLFSNWFSHVGFLTFFGFVIFVLPLCYLLPNARLVKTVSSIIAAIGLALLAFDALLYTKTGLHLSFSSAELIRSEAQTVMQDFGWQQWGYLLMLFVVWFSFQLIIANALWQRIERVQKYRLGIPISGFFVALFVTSHALHVWADANLYQPIVQQDDMFPLSYPATAKTLMSKYNLLDLENYRQRKALQFDSRISGLKYPSSPVYCEVNNSKPVILLIQTDEATIELDAVPSLKRYQSHYDLSSTKQSAMLSSLFGLPEIYLSAVQSRVPLLIDLPSKLGIPVSFYSNMPLKLDALQNISTKWEEFYQGIKADQASLAIGFLSAAQISQLIDQDIASTHVVLVSQMSQDRDKVKAVSLFTNLPLAAELSSHLDLAPTVLNVMGCQANTDIYSTGQNLLAPRRNWLVGTKGSKVIVMQNQQLTEVLSNGNYKIYDRVNGEESAETLDTGLLSQAIKHLSRFTQ